MVVILTTPNSTTPSSLAGTATANLLDILLGILRNNQGGEVVHHIQTDKVSRLREVNRFKEFKVGILPKELKVDILPEELKAGSPKALDMVAPPQPIHTHLVIDLHIPKVTSRMLMM